MTTAEDKAKKSIQSKSFEKCFAVANKKHGEAFDEVNRFVHSILMHLCLAYHITTNYYFLY